VHVEIDGPPSARAQVARVLALDVDATAFAAVGGRDPVVGALQQRFAGLRPVLFGSPYEAAAWALLSQRTRMAQAVALRRRLTAEHGERGAFPAPGALAALPDAVPGLPALKAQRLRALGAAALAGDLDTARLRALSREEALAALQALPGIGPFGAELVLLRGAGDPDAFPANEPRLHAAMRAAYGLRDDAEPDELRAIADGWRPFRSWAAFLLRSGADRTPKGVRPL
jgi:DNA-3-methyladenine glycosylase II